MKIVRVHFIQRPLYSTLLSKDFTLDDIVKVFNRQSDKKVSHLTQEIIQKTKEICISTFFNTSNSAELTGITSKYNVPLTEEQVAYAKAEVNDYLKQENIDFVNESGQKCYEIIICLSAEQVDLVVVVGKGFLSLVTTNSETLSCFYRELLRHCYEQNEVSCALNREYLGLKMNQGYFDLVKLRLEKRD